MQLELALLIGDCHRVHAFAGADPGAVRVVDPRWPDRGTHHRLAVRIEDAPPYDMLCFHLVVRPRLKPDIQWSGQWVRPPGKLWLEPLGDEQHVEQQRRIQVPYYERPAFVRRSALPAIDVAARSVWARAAARGGRVYVDSRRRQRRTVRARTRPLRSGRSLFSWTTTGRLEESAPASVPNARIKSGANPRVGTGYRVVACTAPDIVFLPSRHFPFAASVATIIPGRRPSSERGQRFWRDRLVLNARCRPRGPTGSPGRVSYSPTAQLLLSPGADRELAFSVSRPCGPPSLPTDSA